MQLMLILIIFTAISNASGTYWGNSTTTSLTSKANDFRQSMHRSTSAPS